jgi:hypothetical protein
MKPELFSAKSQKRVFPIGLVNSEGVSLPNVPVKIQAQS